MREPGSFRDPHSRVFYCDEAVLRGLSERGLADWHALERSRVFERGVARGALVGSELADEDLDGYAGVLRHERIAFVSYPYEWTFSMLRDAALLQLELLREALDDDLILKDATPYNVQFRGAQPVFIDVGSFERLREAEPWAGYRQFCTLFLYPLLLQAYKDVPFQAWLRGSIDGIAPQELRNLMSLRDLLRPGVFTHVHLHARLEQRHAARGGEVKQELRRAGFRKELIAANARRLEKLVRRLEWRPRSSEWSGYGVHTSYATEEAERKAAFVRAAAAEREWRLAWDLGCNDGTFSRIAAEHARAVVAVDADHAVVDRLYRALHEERNDRILPLRVDLTDPSPGLGWRGRERTPLDTRGRPELVLCLAVIHHVAITGNVPMRELLEWLRGLGATLVVEFPHRDDPMVQRLLAAKRDDVHDDYERPVFERQLRELFEVARSDEVSPTRTLYLARPR